MELSFNIAGKEKVKAMLDRTRFVVNDLRPIWPEVTENIELQTQEIYNSQGSKGSSGQWKALSKKYAAWKNANYPGKPILVLSGSLQSSLWRGGKDNIKVFNQMSMKWGSSKKVGKYNLGLLHQKGTNKMPARKIMDYTKNFMFSIMKILHKYIYTGNK